MVFGAAVQSGRQAFMLEGDSSVALADTIAEPGVLIGDNLEIYRVGRYRVFPPEVATGGGLSIAGETITAPIFTLAEGMRELRYIGEVQTGFRVQWAPDGKF